MTLKFASRISATPGISESSKIKIERYLRRNGTAYRRRVSSLAFHLCLPLPLPEILFLKSLANKVTFKLLSPLASICLLTKEANRVRPASCSFSRGNSFVNLKNYKIKKNKKRTNLSSNSKYTYRCNCGTFSVASASSIFFSNMPFNLCAAEESTL